MNIFRGRSPDADRQRVFGGQVAGQALVAAARTVDDEHHVHSLHAYFLRPGDPTVPILYEVDRIRDGRSFITRRVVAIQHGKADLQPAASFQTPRGRLRPRGPMPDGPARARVAARLPGAVEGRSPACRATTTTATGPSTPATATGSPATGRSRCRPASGCGCGPTATLPDDPVLHACIFTYASDMTLLDTALLPHGS